VKNKLLSVIEFLAGLAGTTLRVLSNKTVVKAFAVLAGVALLTSFFYDVYPPSAKAFLGIVFLLSAWDANR